MFWHCLTKHVFKTLKQRRIHKEVHAGKTQLGTQGVCYSPLAKTSDEHPPKKRNLGEGQRNRDIGLRRQEYNGIDSFKNVFCASVPKYILVFYYSATEEICFRYCPKATRST